MMIKLRLTIRREVDLAFAGEEGEALPLALELRRELLGRDLLVGNVAYLLLLDVGVNLLHIEIFKILKE